MIKRIALFALCLSLCLGCTGCGSTVELTKNIDAKPAAAGEISSEGVVSAADFSVRLFQQSFEEQENTLLSPICVLSALSMTANGAGGNTLAQMEQVLGMSLAELNDTVGTWQRQNMTDDSSSLKTANSIWFNDTDRFSVNEAFLETGVAYYGSSVYREPFDDQTLKDINRWVSKKTDGMVEDILDRIPEDAMMYLISALAFDAKWQNEYEKNDVRYGRFTQRDGEVVNVTMMDSIETTYIEDENAAGFIKYYKGGEYAFAALLPDKGLSIDEYVATLTGERLVSVLKNARVATVAASLPSFEAMYSAEMSEELMEMGMTDAFDWMVSDFSAMGSMSDETNLCIDRVIHKTFISVAEEGTRAGAAAVVEMAAEGAAMMPEEYYEVILNRPFLYMIIETDTCLPVFIGTQLEFEPWHLKY